MTTVWAIGKIVKGESVITNWIDPEAFKKKQCEKCKECKNYGKC